MNTQESEYDKQQDQESDDEGGFWSDDEEEQVYVNDKKIENYEQYKYSVQENRADLKSQYEAKDLAIRKL